jgi:membrane-bound lytic murein transglycosylase D
VVRYIDLQDSICNYNSSEFLSKRDEVVIDEGPTFVSKRKTRASSRSKRRSRGTSVTIRRGDTLSAIAKRNGTTVSALRKLNGIRGNNVQAGKKIRVR